MAVNGTGSLVILVIVFFGALAFQAQVEGKPQDNFIRDKADNVSRIIDHTEGEDAEPEKAFPGQFPWQVSVSATQRGVQFMCGGSIIDRKWIMSAAHCIAEAVYEDEKKTIPNGYEIISTRVRLIVGKIDRDDTNYGSYKPIVFEAKDISAKGNKQRVFIHEDYNKDIKMTNDIVLFRLIEPLNPNEFVDSIDLATASDVITDKELTATGWGSMSYDIYKPYQSGKYWTFAKCPLVQETKVYLLVSLETCKRFCAINDGCNVFYYKYSVSECALQNCPGVIPEPDGKDEGTIGYTTYGEENTVYRMDKYWTNGQCPKLTKLKHTSLETCKKKCDSYKKCDVFRYNTVTSMCVLQKCVVNIPQPKGTYVNWIGYIIYAAYKAHQTGKIWNRGECGTVEENNFQNQVDGYFPFSLKNCNFVCLQFPTCNAFIYDAKKKKCKLCKIPVPIPEPTGSVDGFIGYTFHKGRISKTLRYVTGLDLKNQDECVKLHPGELSSIGTVICTQTPNKTVYSGDSGGPLVFEIGLNEPPIYVQIGITSFGPVAGNDVSFFTNVAMLNPWILKTMGSDFTGDSSCTISRLGSKGCKPKSCPDKEGFFTLTVGGPKQCFKVIKQAATWEKANEDCKKLNLTLAQPFAPVQLRSYIVQTYGAEFFVWLGACQEPPKKMIWKRSGEEITSNDPLWYPGQPDFPKGCLLLLSSKEYFEDKPGKPFWNVLPKFEFYPLCELVLE